MDQTETPKTLADARFRNHVELTPEETAAVPVTHGEVTPLVQDCTTLPTNALCGETACVDGIKVAFYCDPAGGCTKAVKIPC